MTRVTDEHIRRLCIEAAETNNRERVKLCERALYGEPAAREQCIQLITEQQLAMPGTVVRYYCTSDEYAIDGSWPYESAGEFLDMCKYVFDEVPELTEREPGRWHDEYGRCVLERRVEAK